MDDDIRYIDPLVFIDIGFLQEANRRFFHPLGLALEADPSAGPDVPSMRVWDYRDDPEGIAFTSACDPEKEERVAMELQRHEAARLARFGWVVQPVNEAVDSEGQ